MSKITITICCTGEEIEVANFLLGRAVEDAKGNKEFQKIWKVTPAKLEKAEKFRLKLIEEYFKL